MYFVIQLRIFCLFIFCLKTKNKIHELFVSFVYGCETLKGRMQVEVVQEQVATGTGTCEANSLWFVCDRVRSLKLPCLLNSFSRRPSHIKSFMLFLRFVCIYTLLIIMECTSLISVFSTHYAAVLLAVVIFRGECKIIL